MRLLTIAMLVASSSDAIRIGDKLFVVADVAAEVVIDNEVVGKIPRGALIQVEDLNDSLVGVRWKGMVGWINKYHLADFSEARKIFYEAVEGNPTALNYLCRGMSFGSNNFLSLKDYNTAIKLDPSFAPAYNARGYMLLNKEDYEEAEADFSKAIELSPGFANAYNNRGTVRDELGKHEKAIEDYSKAIQLDGYNPSAFVNRGNSWLRKEEYGKMIADYESALQLEPDDSYVHAQLTWVRATCSGYTDGKKAVEHGIKAGELTYWRHPNDELNFACALAENGQFSDAIKILEHLVEESKPGKGQDFAKELISLFKRGKPYRHNAEESDNVWRLYWGWLSTGMLAIVLFTGLLYQYRQANTVRVTDT